MTEKKKVEKLVADFNNNKEVDKMMITAISEVLQIVGMKYLCSHEPKLEQPPENVPEFLKRMEAIGWGAPYILGFAMASKIILGSSSVPAFLTDEQSNAYILSSFAAASHISNNLELANMPLKQSA